MTYRDGLIFEPPNVNRRNKGFLPVFLHGRIRCFLFVFPHYVTNLDFPEQNTRFKNVECKSTLTSNFCAPQVSGLKPVAS